MSKTYAKSIKKSPRGRTKNVLASNVWPKLPVVAKSKVTGSADEVCNFTGDRALTERVAELEVSYKNLINMYDTQIKINDELLKHISILAAHCLACTDKRMNSFAPMLPRIIHPQDKLRYFKNDRSTNLMFYDDGSIITSMIECDMHAPLIKCIFDYTDADRQIYDSSQFVENVKIVIDRTPWHLLTSNTSASWDKVCDVHLLDALEKRAFARVADQHLWQEIYHFAVAKQQQVKLQTSSAPRATLVRR